MYDKKKDDDTINHLIADAKDNKPKCTNCQQIILHKVYMKDFTEHNINKITPDTYKPYCKKCSEELSYKIAASNVVRLA